MDVSISCSLFLESLSDGQRAHNYLFLAGDVARVICRHDKTTFAEAVTDNTSFTKNRGRSYVESYHRFTFKGDVRTVSPFL